MDIKTTEELIAILEAEKTAYTKGNRVVPYLPPNADEVAAERYGIVGAVLGAENLTNMAYYHKFLQKVWEYQKQHQISGLIVETVLLGNKIYRFPVAAEQLLLVEGDLDILRAAVTQVMEAFAEYVNSHSVYLCYTHHDKWDGEHNIQTTLEFIQYEATNADWAKIIAFDGDPCVSLSLGWGNPHSAMNLEDEEGDEITFDALISCNWSVPLKAERITLTIEEIMQMRQEGKFDIS